MAINLITIFSGNKGMKKGLSLFILIVATVMLASAPFTTNQAFANHLSDEMKWQVVVISSYPACSNAHYQMMSKFDEVTEKYLGMYQLDNSKYEPTCIPDSKYYSEYTSPPDLDLIILVYDRNLGEKELHSQNMGGLYSHTGIDRKMNHAIIICGDCPTFNFSNPVWILSHELSHFVLYYLDYDLDVIEDLIHEYDVLYDQCMESQSNSCQIQVTKLKAYSYNHSVMPLYEPAINNESPALAINNVSPIVMDLTKVITKWWAAGKITDGDYANAVGFMIDKDVISSHGYNEILFADEPIDTSVTWKEMISEITPNYSDRVTISGDGINEMLLRVPNIMKSNEKIIYSDDLISGLPDWFKITAGWWAQDLITDKEMMKYVEYLRDAGIIRPH